MTYPTTPGFKVEGPSREAADAIAPDAGTLRADVFNALLKAPSGLTADEVAGVLRLHPFSIRPRVSELRMNGLIEDSGERRQNNSGKRATVWRVCK